MSTFNWDIDSWKVLDLYFSDDSRLVQHQLESFNDYIDVLIPQIIERNNPILINTDYDKDIDKFLKIYEIKFGETYISKPIIHENNDIIKKLLPAEARKRNLTYASPLYVDVEHSLKIYDKSKKEYTIMKNKEEKILLANVPIMLHSKYCHLSDKSGQSRSEMGECEFDNGGYFIVNGSEKVVVAQERICENRVFVFEPSKSSLDKYKCKAEIKTSTDQRFYPTKTNSVCLTSDPQQQLLKKMFTETEFTGNLFKVQMPQIKEDLPLFIMFRALGITDDKTIYEIILSDITSETKANYINLLYYSNEECRNEDIYTQASAIEYLGSKLKNHFDDTVQLMQGTAQQAKEQLKITYVKDIINREFLPHLGQNNLKKAYFLGYMVKRLMDAYFEVRPYDDRDHYSSKRLDLTGKLLSEVYRTEWLTLIKEIRKTIINHLLSGDTKPHTNIRKLIQGNTIENKLNHCLATGNWGGQKSATDQSKKGIAQVMNRLAYQASLSHTRRIHSPLATSGSKIVKPRRVDQTHYGMNCIDETPEGQQIGIVKNLAMQCSVSIHFSDASIRLAISKFPEFCDLLTISPDQVYRGTKIFINGDWIGIVHDNDANTIYNKLKTMKRHNIIMPYTSVAWYIEWKEIYIQTDGGRYMRPLFIVDPIENELLIDRAVKKGLNLESGVTWGNLIDGSYSDENPDKLNVNNGGLIEYMDTNELDCSMVAHSSHHIEKMRMPDTEVYSRYTHCEINPMMQKGIVSQMIPFANHNPSPRNCYQCLWIEETVLMSDGKYKRIADVKVGDEVISVNPENYSRSFAKVINQFVKTTEKVIVKTVLVTGRSLVSTDDHLILTSIGWVKAGDLTDNHYICICTDISDNDHMVFSEYSRTYTNVSTTIENFLKNDIILKKNTTGTLFVRCATVTKQENVLIADITLDNTYHSFITGSRICVHNSSMGKQAIGYYTTNYNSRMDTMAHILVYGQKAPCSTRTMKYTFMDRLPHGATPTLAYASYTGYNQEDAQILNLDSIERGLFNTLFFRTYVDMAQKHKSASQNSELFKNPKKTEKV